MNKTIISHLAVYDELKLFYSDNKIKFIPYPHIVSIYDNVEENRTTIQTLGTEQGKKNLGIAQDKNSARLSLILNVLQNAGPAASYFFKQKDMTNYNDIFFPDYILKRMKPEILLSSASIVIDLCTINVIVLTGTGVTTGTIGKLSDAKDLFDPQKNAPDSKKKTKSILTKKISILDKATFEIIRKELNQAMLIFMTSDEEFYNDYIKLTQITNPPTRKRKSKIIKATVTVIAIHDLTSELLDGISIKFAGIKGTLITNTDGAITAELPLGAQLGKAVGVDFEKNNFVFTLTIDGLTITIRMIPTGV